MADVSLIKGDMIPWLVAQSGYTSGAQGEAATDAAAAAYDWYALRAGQLDADQIEDQRKACERHVKEMLKTRPKTSLVGSVLLMWVLGAIISAIVKALIGRIFSSQKSLSAWQTLHRPRSAT